MKGSSRTVLVLSCLAAFGLAGGLAGAAQADAMQCGHKLVSTGDSMYDVQSRCGMPDMTLQRVEYRTLQQYGTGPCFQVQGQMRCTAGLTQSVPVVLDTWTYDYGPHQFVRTLVFEQGVLRNVLTGHYGTKKRG